MAQSTWLRIPTQSKPSPRRWAEIAFDYSRDQLVMFGGLQGNGTWLFDGREWSQATPASAPQARVAHQMVYDVMRQNVVLFGGEGSFGYLPGTWTFDGQDWTLEQPARSPVPRTWFKMVYHLTAAQVLVIGGWDGTALQSDTVLAWDGSNWTDLSPPVVGSPFPRLEHAAAYDIARDRVVVYGGFDGATLLSDTWEWDGSTWSLAAPSNQGPVPLSTAGMAAELGTGRSVMFSGWQIPIGYSNETRTWDGSNWVVESPLRRPPPPRGLPTLDMATDLVRGRTLLLLGDLSHDLELWEWGPAPYVEFGHGCGAASRVPVLTACPGSRPRIGTTFCAEVSNLPGASGVVFMAFSVGDNVPWIDLATIGMPGCERYVDQSFGTLWLGRNAANVALWSLPIPNDPGLVGVRFVNQGAVYDAMVPGPVPVTTTNGAIAEIGA